LFDSNGNKIGDEYEATNLANLQPDITAFADGGFAIGAQTNGNSDYGFTKVYSYVQRFKSDGKKNGTEHMLSDYLAGGQAEVALITGNINELYAVYSGVNPNLSSSGQGIFCSLFDIHGRRVNEVGLVNTSSGDPSNYASVVLLNKNKIAITYGRNDKDGSGVGAYAKIFQIEYKIEGSEQGDELIGDDGVATMYGYGGDDTLEGKGGADYLDGGEGTDMAVYSSSPAAVYVNLAENIASGGDAEGDTFKSIENLSGSKYNDELIGDSKSNELRGEDGDDMLEGNGGGDILDGGDGIDTVSYANSKNAVRVNLATGSGYITSENKCNQDKLIDIENVIGSANNDTIVGNSKNNKLFGGDGNDVLVTGGGDDILIGGKGADIFRISQGVAGSNTAQIPDFDIIEDKLDLRLFKITDISQLKMKEFDGYTKVTWKDSINNDVKYAVILECIGVADLTNEILLV
jgi:Ca2+-binding RTX toxin-like protein